MAAVKNEAAPGRSYATPDDATKVKDMLAQLQMGQRGAARELEISERMMRYYCGGSHAVPKVVILALERLVDLQRRVGGK